MSEIRPEDLVRTELPPGWEWATLEDLVSHERDPMTDGPFGSKLKSDHYVAAGVRVIRLGNIGVGVFKHDDKAFISHDYYLTLRKHEVLPGDLLIAALAEPVGRCCEVPPGVGTSIVKADCIKYRPHSAVDRQFLLNWLNSPRGRKNAEALSHGIGRLRMNMSNMRALPVPVAPVAEQKRIMVKLDAIRERREAAKGALDAVPPLLERFRQSVLAAAFRGDLTKEWRAQHTDVEPATELLKRIRTERRCRWEQANPRKKYVEPEPVDGAQLPALPKGWCWVRAEDLAGPEPSSICAGPFGTIFKARDFRPAGVPIVFLRHVAPGRYLTQKPGFMDREKWEELFRPYSVFGGELLIAKLGEPPGACAIYPEGIGPAMVTPDVIKMEPTPEVAAPHYLMHYFNSEVARKMTFGMAYGTTRLRMTLDLFRQMPVPLAPPQEQHELLAVLHATFSRLDAIEHRYRALTDQLNALEQAVLAKAFKGDLVPQDSTEESAAVLLERLRRQPNGGETKGATKRSPL